MRKSIHKITAHPLIAGSVIIFTGSVLSGFLHFLFNLFMTRNLSVADYGALASLLSLTTLFGLIIGAFVPTLIKFSGHYFALNDYQAVKTIYIKVFGFSLLVGVTIFILSFLFSREIGIFFHIKEIYLIPFVGILTLISYLAVINTIFIQAKLSFTFLSFINFLTAIIKLISGVFLVFIGMKLVGALWANMIATVVPYLISFIPLGFLFKKYELKSNIHFGEILSFGIPASVCMFALASFINADILLVKHLFDPHTAGLYSALSLVGRVIYFFTAPIATVMFPLVIQKKAKSEKYHTIFELSIFLVFSACMAMVIFYFLFPEFTINFFLKNTSYLPLKPYIGLFGIFTTIYSLLFIMVNYFLSIGKTKIVYPVCIAAVGQIIAILMYHSTFIQVIFGSLFTTGLLLIFLLLYYLKSERYDKR